MQHEWEETRCKAAYSLNIAVNIALAAPLADKEFSEMLVDPTKKAAQRHQATVCTEWFSFGAAGDFQFFFSLHFIPATIFSRWAGKQKFSR